MIYKDLYQIEIGNCNCTGDKIFTIIQDDSPYTFKANLGGILEWNGKDNLNDFTLNIILNQLNQMIWTNDLIYKAVMFFNERDLYPFIHFIPDPSFKNNELKLTYDYIKLLNLIENNELQYDIKVLNRNLRLRVRSVEVIDSVSCYINKKYKYISTIERDQMEMLLFLKQYGGRFLASYINI